MYGTTGQQNMMEKLPHYQKKYDEWKQIRVYYIKSFDSDRNEKMYFYAIANASLHDKMLLSLKDGNIPHFAVIVEKGYGDPTPEVKAKMKTYYGFDHDRYANDNDATGDNP